MSAHVFSDQLRYLTNYGIFRHLLSSVISNYSLFFYQDSLTSWIDDIGSDEEESDTDEEPLDDATIVISDDSLSESGTDEEDELRPSKPNKKSLCSPYF
jgi:hypothetical protein